MSGFTGDDVHGCCWWQLTDEERVFLNAAALGDVPIVRQSLDDGALTLNVNCVDYMGRSALQYGSSMMGPP